MGGSTGKIVKDAGGLQELGLFNDVGGLVGGVMNSTGKIVNDSKSGNWFGLQNLYEYNNGLQELNLFTDITSAVGSITKGTTAVAKDFDKKDSKTIDTVNSGVQAGIQLANAIDGIFQKKVILL